MLYNKNIKLNNPNDSAVILFNYIEPGSTVLDMGCACGDLAAKLVREKSCDVYGLEYNEESVAQCRKLNVFEQIRQFDLNRLAEDSFPQYREKFDYVILGDVLEHLYNPPAVLKIAAGYLKSGKYLLISLPNLAHASIKANLLLNDFSYTELGILDKTHLRFFTYRSIASLLANAGLDISQIEYTTLPADGYQPHSLSELPEPLQDFILQDKHSAVFQYVLKCRTAKNASVVELEEMLNSFAKPSLPPATWLFRLKRLMLTKFSGLIKYIEKLR